MKFNIISCCVKSNALCSIAYHDSVTNRCVKSRDFCCPVTCCDRVTRICEQTIAQNADHCDSIISCCAALLYSPVAQSALLCSLSVYLCSVSLDRCGFFGLKSDILDCSPDMPYALFSALIWFAPLCSNQFCSALLWYALLCSAWNRSALIWSPLLCATLLRYGLLQYVVFLSSLVLSSVLCSDLISFTRPAVHFGLLPSVVLYPALLFYGVIRFHQNRKSKFSELDICFVLPSVVYPDLLFSELIYFDLVYSDQLCPALLWPVEPYSTVPYFTLLWFTLPYSMLLSCHLQRQSSSAWRTL